MTSPRLSRRVGEPRGAETLADGTLVCDEETGCLQWPMVAAGDDGRVDLGEGIAAAVWILDTGSA